MALRRIVGQQIARLRDSLVETQVATAAAVGIDRATLANIEAGYDAIELGTANALAGHFDVSLDHLLCHEVSPEQQLVDTMSDQPDNAQIQIIAAITVLRSDMMERIYRLEELLREAVTKALPALHEEQRNMNEQQREMRSAMQQFQQQLVKIEAREAELLTSQ